AQAQQKHAELQARQQALTEKQQDIAQRISQSDQNHAQINAQMAELPPEADSQTRLDELQQDTRSKESAYRENDQAFLGMQSQYTNWQNRQQSVTREVAEWQERNTSHEARLQSVQERLARV